MTRDGYYGSHWYCIGNKTDNFPAPFYWEKQIKKKKGKRKKQGHPIHI